MHFIEVKADLLQHGLSIRIVNRMLTTLDHVAVQLRGVGHVEVSHHHEALRGPVATPHVGVTGGFSKGTRGSVSQVAHEHLTAELEVLLDDLGIFGIEVVLFAEAIKVPFGIQEDFLQGVFFDGPLAKQIRRAQRHVQLATADPLAVLTTIPLFHHQHVKLLIPPKRGAIFVFVVGQRFSQTHHCDAALVFDWIAHSLGSDHLWH